ncbi:D-alanyl-D-alanine carboxypeptidase family protein [Oenococcus alcoholitolerans]|uniref:D-alanyl-D-alanine carboxypeptidase family protein n=1 Tax=Oenococcus alcoholitolerans TaxID=931074 RepID=UPI003F6FEE75
MKFYFKHNLLIFFIGFSFFLILNFQIYQKAQAAVLRPVVNAKAAIVVDERTGQILAEKNIDQRYPIASITKLLTAYQLLDKLKRNHQNLNDYIKIDPQTAWLSHDAMVANIPLQAGRYYKISDLLTYSMLASANGAADALAVFTNGSIAKSDLKTSLLLNSWGIKNTHIFSPNGLPNGLMGPFADNRFSPASENLLSAREVAVLSCKLLNKFPYIRTVSSRKEFLINNGYEKLIMRNISLPKEEIDPRYAFTGLKTGSALSIGGNFVGESKIKGRRVVTVVLGSGSFNDFSTRFIESTRILRQVDKKMHLTEFNSKNQDIKFLRSASFKGIVHTKADHQKNFFFTDLDQPKIYEYLHVFKNNKSFPAKKNSALAEEIFRPADSSSEDFLNRKGIIVLLKNSKRIQKASKATIYWREFLYGKEYKH